jgi:hypothetical protein
MKTIEQVNKQIEANLSAITNPKTDRKETNRLMSENEFLKSIALYLETNPKQEYLLWKREQLNSILSAKLSTYSYWNEHVCPNDVPKDKREELFEENEDLKSIRKHIKSIEYILNN